MICLIPLIIIFIVLVVCVLKFGTYDIGTGRAGATGLAISFVTEEDSAIFPELVDYLRKKNQPIPIDLERHKAVKEASQLSKFKAEENEDGTIAPTEFKMILRVCSIVK